MKKWIVGLFVVLLLLAACEQEEPELSEQETVEETVVETVETEEIPEEIGPDEEGYFPLISEEAWQTQVIGAEGEADLAPPEEPVTALLEDETCVALLNEKYPSVKDWVVLFEEDTYRQMNTFDPYNNCYRWQYVPYRMAVLQTATRVGFDYLVAVSYDCCQVEQESGGYRPRQQTVLLARDDPEKEWKLGDLSEAQLIADEDEKSFSLWMAAEETALLVQVEQDYCTAKFVSNMAEQPPILVESLSLAKSQYGGADWLLDVKIGEEITNAYYRTADQTLYYFEDGAAYGHSPWLPQAYYMGFIHESYINFYDLTAADPGKIVKTLGGEGKGLSQKEVIFDRNSLSMDWGDLSTYAIFYYEEDGEHWNIARLDSRGNVLNFVETTLSVPQEGKNYITDAELLDGILSFKFHDSDETEKYYCLDIRPDSNHRLYVKELTFQLGLDESSQQNLAIGDKIGMWTLKELDFSNGPAYIGLFEY